MTDWVQRLYQEGDPIERNSARYDLGKLFPRYAEYWGKYVHPNRHPEIRWKHRENFPIEIEDISNYHYLVYYHLVYVCRQLNDLTNPVLDISDPFHHLGSVRDVATQVFVMAIHVRECLEIGTRVSPIKFEDDDVNIRRKRTKSVIDYLKNHFSSFESELDSFNEVYDFKIKKYRDMFTHDLPPLRPIENGIPLIPKPDKLDYYRAGRYSTQHGQQNDFEPARDLLQSLVNEVASQLNTLWETLLLVMDEIASSNQYRSVFNKLEEKSTAGSQVYKDSIYLTEPPNFTTKRRLTDESGNYQVSGGTLTADDWNYLHRNSKLADE